MSVMYWKTWSRCGSQLKSSAMRMLLSLGGRLLTNGVSVCLSYDRNAKVIKPQYAVECLYELSKMHNEVYITTEVGQHQMWAAQHFHFEHPNR